MFYVGIDITKHNYEASVIDSYGNLLYKSLSFSNTQKGCEKLIVLFHKFSSTKEDIVIGMEATGHYWLSVYSFFLKRDMI